MQQVVADEQRSVARQVAHAREYAAKHGWTIDDTCVFVLAATALSWHHTHTCRWLVKWPEEAGSGPDFPEGVRVVDLLTDPSGRDSSPLDDYSLPIRRVPRPGAT